MAKTPQSTPEFDLFKQEADLLAKAKAIQAADSSPEEVNAAFQELLGGYQKLFRETRRLIRLSDRSEAELREARKQAEAATRAKASFLAAMSHEIRTPMNGIVGMIDLLAQTRMDDDQRQMMATVRNSAGALLTIINDILDFSKIEAGKLDLESISFSLREIVEGVGDTMVPVAQDKGLEVATFVDPELPEQVLGDPVRLRQILLNLAGNAVKFSEVDATAAASENRVVIRADRVDETIYFRVTDHGIGMSPQAVSNLFKPFTQADNSTTRRFGGTGLGLSICKNLTDLMDGRIGVESREGDGSTFEVWLPLDTPEDAPVVDAGALAGLKLGLALPNTDDTSFAAAYLRQWGAETVELNTASLPPIPDLDLVVMDDRWSHAAMDEVGASAEGQPIVFLTGVESSSAPRSSTVDAVNRAPLRRALLVNAVARLLGRSAPEAVGDLGGVIARAERADTPEEALALGRLILVADDTPTNRDVIMRQIRALGYAGEAVNDGVEALDALRQKQYGLLLSDCHMPNMDGFTLARTLRDEETPETRLPIVAVTASAMKEDEDQCMAAGMDGVLVKPLDMAKLKDVLEFHLPTRPEANETLPSDDPFDDIAALLDAPAPAEPEGNTPVDASVLKGMFGDDDATFKEILGDFAEPAVEIATEIVTGFTNNDAAAVGAAAHKLKSAARSIGANALADLAFELEKSGKADDWLAIEEHMPTLDPLVKDVLDYIAAL
jgi:signal transduction histidine kinase/CheY-like chemotaxis protein/HPt (histidine-containing phosphotransfer) domain-containing protein